MHITRKTAGRVNPPHRSFTFVEAIVRYGDLTTDKDLMFAYEKARPFAGELEQNFIILTEEGLTACPRGRPRGSGAGFEGSIRAGGGGRGARGRGGRGGWGGGRGGPSKKRQNDDESAPGTSKMRKT